MATPGLLQGINPDDLIERVQNGEIPSRIATQLGVTKAAVYYHLAHRKDWQDARKLGMHIRLDEAEGNISDSTDQLTLSRAREAFRAVAWRAEREHPDAWGNAQRVMGGDGGPVQIEIVRYSSPATLEAEVSTDLAKLAK